MTELLIHDGVTLKLDYYLKDVSRAVFVKTKYRVETLNMKPYTKNSCNPCMMTVLAELQ